jgi:hypothetical protein
MMNPIAPLVLAICGFDSGSPESNLGAQGSGVTCAEDGIDEHCCVPHRNRGEPGIGIGMLASSWQFVFDSSLPD